jgi:hypothetical protein
MEPIKYYTLIPLPSGSRDPCEGCIAEDKEALCDSLDCEPGWIYKRTSIPPEPNPHA